MQKEIDTFKNWLIKRGKFISIPVTWDLFDGVISKHFPSYTSMASHFYWWAFKFENNPKEIYFLALYKATTNGDAWGISVIRETDWVCVFDTLVQSKKIMDYEYYDKTYDTIVNHLDNILNSETSIEEIIFQFCNPIKLDLIESRIRNLIKNKTLLKVLDDLLICFNKNKKSSFSLSYRYELCCGMAKILTYILENFFFSNLQSEGDKIKLLFKEILKLADELEVKDDSRGGLGELKDTIAILKIDFSKIFSFEKKE